MESRWVCTYKTHKNKAGATNEMKHPLAQQVETWNDKKNKMLESLGMTNKGKSVQKRLKMQGILKLMCLKMN